MGSAQGIMENDMDSNILSFNTYLVNLDRAPERLVNAMGKLSSAGFSNVQRWKAVDGTNAEDLTKTWELHGNPKKEPMDPEFVMYPGRQGCMLSHVGIWKHMIENDIPIANVFEDDIMFHPQWAALHDRFYEDTPTNFDILYLGSKHHSDDTNHIQTSPVYCTHAYTITNLGARKLYQLLVGDPRGVCTIDNHIRRFMLLGRDKCPFTWYSWNSTGYPCKEADMPADFKWRNAGLVFQDYRLPSYIQQDY